MTTTPKWTAGTLYSPGDLVQPNSVPVYIKSQPANNDFATGTFSGWTQTGVWAIQNLNPFVGTYSAATTATGAHLDQATPQPVNPGQKITATAMAKLTNAGTDNGYAAVELHWQDASHVDLGTVNAGNGITGAGGYYKPSTVTASAPPGAAYVYIRMVANAPTGGQVDFGRVTWDYTFSGTISGLLFEATQANPGKSGSVEPTWPGSVGLTVTDNEVTWTAVAISRIVWQASPILTSGNAEPAWPLQDGAVVLDGNIDWTAHTKQITDTNCPNSKQVLIAAGKVYAAGGDILNHSAVADPTDWTTSQDAGFLPFGQNPYGSNDIEVLSLYRSNVVALNDEGFQMWQVDPNPSLSALLDSLPIPSSAYRASVPVGNDLQLLTPVGVRSLAIAAANDSLEGDDESMAVDALIQQYSATADADPIGIPVPALGQAWWVFNNGSACNVMVSTRSGGTQKWTRYSFPFRIDDYAVVGTVLYLRGGDDVLKLDASVHQDFAGNVRAVAVDGFIQWPYLDMGAAGVDKNLTGMDIVGSGTASVEIGFDESDLTKLTTAFTAVADSLPGHPMPMDVSAPSMSIKLSFTGGQAWSNQMVVLYLDDAGGIP